MEETDSDNTQHVKSASSVPGPGLNPSHVLTDMFTVPGAQLI